MGLAFVPLIANQKIKSMNVIKLMVIEQSNMEAKRFAGYSQGRRQVFRTGGSKIVPSSSSLSFPFLLLFLVGRPG